MERGRWGGGDGAVERNTGEGIRAVLAGQLHTYKGLYLEMAGIILAEGALPFGF
jgi:hypothetical protein